MTRDGSMLPAAMDALPTDLRPDVERLLELHPPGSADDRGLREARFDAGLAFPGFRPGCGGRGLDDPSAGRLVETAFLAAGAADWADRNVIGLGMAAPTLHEHGSPDQLALLRPLFTGEHIWCQLFSEPGSGSDLASVSTRAVRDGERWIIDGQKVWTTLGHLARWGLLLARTGDEPRHRGLTYFVLDMQLPGIEVRPLRQMTGEAEFNEVFLDGVEVPAEAVLGITGGGWSVAMTTLMSERTALQHVPAVAGLGLIEQAVAVYRSAGSDPIRRDQLMRVWVQAEVGRLTAIRAQQAMERGIPGPEGSVSKLSMAELNKAILGFVMGSLGAEGMLIDHYDEVRPDRASVHGGSDLRKAFLRTRANSIEGGTSEVLRNVLGERVLGLPREP